MLPKFQALWLSEKTISALEKKWFEEPSPIQEQTIPLLLEGKKDIIWQAQTWTGKTAAFGLPIIETITERKSHVQAIILAPTRELAVQVAEEIQSLQWDKWILRVLPVYGGQSMSLQLRSLRNGVDVVVGTPGRVMDHLDRKTLKIDKVRYFVLDEADEMLNMWFIDDIEKIFTYANPERQTLLFSATMPREILHVAKKYMKEHTVISVKKNETTTENVEQIYFQVREADKFESLSRIIDIEEEFYGIIFCKTKVDTDRVASHLSKRWYDAAAIHWDIEQRQRERILKAFKAKNTKILVATDVAARGIDVQDLTHVINYSLPNDPESYVHRIGRTGRAWSKGIAITFVTPNEYKKLAFFQRVTKASITKKDIPEASKVIDRKKERLQNQILAELSSEKSLTPYKEFAATLLADNDPEDLVAALLKHSYSDELDAKEYKNIEQVSVDTTWVTRLFIALGRNKGYDARKLVDYIKEISWVSDKELDDVRILDDFSFVTAPFAAAEMIMRSFNSIKSGGRSLVSQAKEKSSGGGRGKRSGGWGYPRGRSKSSWGRGWYSRR